MSDIWAVVLLMTVGVVVIKTSGPFLIGHRELPGWAMPVITVLPGALLTAIIVVQVLSDGKKIVVDERLLGLAVAGSILWWRRNALLAAVVAAAASVALIRAVV